MPARSRRLNPAFGAALRAVEARQLQQNQAAACAGLKEGPRLPQPGPARSRISRVEPPRRPSFAPLISTHADPDREIPNAYHPHFDQPYRT